MSGLDTASRQCSPDSMSKDLPLSADAYGKSLRGVGFNLIVNDLERALTFATEVLGATQFFRTENFAAMKLHGADFMYHLKETYKHNELYGSLSPELPRGIGVELRLYSVDPDEAEARARAHGFTVVAGSLDKPHGLRECMIADDEGFVWVVSRHL
jgi:uncharacterized glyoxalase superfamily protein PhnB